MTGHIIVFNNPSKNEDYPCSFTANLIDKDAFEKLSLLFEKVFHFLSFILRTWSSY